MNKKIIEKLIYVRDHPHSGAWFKGNGKIEVTFTHVGCNDEETESVFSIDISNLTFTQAKTIIGKLQKLRLDEEVYRK